MKLTMLGTGHAVVTKCYNTCFVLEDNNELLLVDGGGGSGLLTQFEKAHISFLDIHHIFITHKHLDHLTGILWMFRMVLSMMSAGKYQGIMTIYCHDEVYDILNDLVYKLFPEKLTQFMNDRFFIQEVKDGEVIEILGHQMTCFDIHSTKDKQFGFSLKYDGKIFTCLGDEPYNEYEKQYATNCDYLMHEAFCLYSQKDIFKPYEKHHSTAKDACMIAEELGVKNLIMYHTEDVNIERRKELYYQEGKPFYNGNLYIPDDLEIIEL